MYYKKNVIKAVAVVGFIMLLASLSYMTKKEGIFYQDSDDDLAFWFSDMETLIDSSDYVLICEIDQRPNKDMVIISESKREIILAFTSTPVIVEAILKGDDSFTVGSEIQVAEPYFLYSTRMKDRTYKTVNGYRPMQGGKRYLLFLRTDNWDKYYFYKGVYEPVGYFQGKIPMAYIESETYSQDDLGEDEIAIQNHHHIHKQIIAIRSWWYGKSDQ